MVMHVISALVGIVGAALLLLWWRAHRRGERAVCRRLCMWGAALALSNLLWELYWVKQGAPPAQGTPEQRALMFRLAAAPFAANLLLVIGLFELSLKNHHAPRR